MAFDLDRFVRAQDRGAYDQAMEELASGRKRSHWIWYVFPQLRELGRSSTALHYGLDGVEEAEAWLGDPLLRARLGQAVATVHRQVLEHSPRLENLMGSKIDALKLVSCLTLFEAVARRLDSGAPSPEVARLASQAAEILAFAEAQGYARCPVTLARLGRWEG